MNAHTHTQLTEEEVECLRGCSTYVQYCTMRKRFETSNCPFCNLDRELNKVLHEDTCWVAWEVPQSFTTRQSTVELHLIMAPKRHIRNIDDMSFNEWVGLKGFYQWAFREYPILKLKGGGDLARFGDMRYNVGTVPHYHINTMVPNGKGAVILPLQKSPEMWEEHDERMRGFATRYEAGEVPE